MRELPPTDILNLETMIDDTSLSVVLDALAEICEGKAQHLQENWQESERSPLVLFWTRFAEALGDVCLRVKSSEHELGIRL